MQSKGSGPQMVRRLQKSGGGSHLPGHMLFSWQHSSLVSPNLPNAAESTLHAQVEQCHRPAMRTEKAVVAKPSATQASTAKPHGPGAAALYHTEQGKTWAKEKSQPCAKGSKYMLPACRSSSPTLQLLLLPSAQLRPWAQLVPGQTGSKRKE